MKIFLATSVAAMIAAGIYGSIDLANDIKGGTLIQYEKDDIPIKKTASVISVKTIKDETVRTLAEAIKKEKNERAVTKKELRMEYFSREAMPVFAEPELIEDSTGVAKADTTNKVVLRADTATKLAAKEEIKLSPKLFSRSRPKRIIEKAVATQALDSVKAVSSN